MRHHFVFATILSVLATVTTIQSHEGTPTTEKPSGRWRPTFWVPDPADLLLDVDEKQFAVIYPKVKWQGERGLPLLIGGFDRKLPPDAKDEAKERLAKQQANAAVALLKMGRPETVWPLLKHSPDPRVRSYLIHRFGPLAADAKVIVKQLDEEPEMTIRRALILSLGEFGEEDLSPADRKGLLPKLQEMYRTATDPGLHASAEWLLRSWRQDAWLKQVNEEWAKDKKQRERQLDAINQALATDKEKMPRWYVNGQGQTMVVIPGPVEFLMGSTKAGAQKYDSQHKKRIGRTFSLAAKAVTVGQILKMRTDYFGRKVAAVRRYAPTDDCPAVAISWLDAAAYCNWLSEQEDIDKKQWCYECYESKGMTKLKENYLTLSGYRLPTDAEMEYATRAGALTSRYYGETDDLLPKYAWYQKNAKGRTWPVGSLKPNDLGFFDMYGNACEWCQDAYKAYPKGEDGKVYDDNDDGKDDAVRIITETNRVWRGGSFSLRAKVLNSAIRFGDVPSFCNRNVGFRVAKTIAR